MSEIIKPNSVEELERLIEQGYNSDRLTIQNAIKISKTQFYDYIYKEVSRVKVNKKLRDSLKEKYQDNLKEKNSNEFKDYSGDIFYELTIERILKHDHIILFNYGKINEFIKENDLLIYELYDIENDKYTKLNKKELKESALLLRVAFDSAATRSELQKEIVIKETNNFKTLESRFYIELKKHNHFRIRICGKYLYSIIDQIKKLDINNVFFRKT